MVYKDLGPAPRPQKPKYMYTKHLQAQKKYGLGLDIRGRIAMMAHMTKKKKIRRKRRRDQQLADQKTQKIERDLEQRSEQYERMWDDEFPAQYDDDPNPYHGTYSEE